ncbi:MAG: hypothetical protein AAGC70_09350 [Pseudomonadota bacterium]
MTPDHIHQIHWDHALSVSRQTCARLFRDGASPKDALAAFGLKDDGADVDWSRAIDRIAEVICTQPNRRAA